MPKKLWRICGPSPRAYLCRSWARLDHGLVHLIHVLTMTWLASRPKPSTRVNSTIQTNSSLAEHYEPPIKSVWFWHFSYIYIYFNVIYYSYVSFSSLWPNWTRGTGLDPIQWFNCLSNILKSIVLLIQNFITSTSGWLNFSMPNVYVILYFAGEWHTCMWIRMYFGELGFFLG